MRFDADRTRRSAGRSVEENGAGSPSPVRQVPSKGPIVGSSPTPAYMPQRSAPSLFSSFS